MPNFSVTGGVDPFLLVSLQQGEKIYCESDAMVMMEANLELKGRMTGGVLGSLMRRMANGESFFQQHIEAVRGGGDCLLSPTLPGAIELVDVGPRRYTLNDGAFVAATDGVEMKTRMQGIGNALFAQSGGLFVMEATGSGKLAVSGFGSSANEPSERVAALSEDARNAALTDMVRQVRQDCDRVVRSMLMGRGREGYMVWSVGCANQKSFTVGVAPEAHGRLVVFSCEDYQAFSKLAVEQAQGRGDPLPSQRECWKKF